MVGRNQKRKCVEKIRAERHAPKKPIHPKTSKEIHLGRNSPYNRGCLSFFAVRENIRKTVARIDYSRRKSLYGIFFRNYLARDRNECRLTLSKWRCGAT